MEAGTRFSVGWYKVLSAFHFSRVISGVEKGDIKICEVCLYISCKDFAVTFWPSILGMLRKQIGFSLVS